MNNGLIIYNSKYGATKKYADALSKKLNIPAKTTKDAKNLESYDTLIFGGGLYAARISGIKLLTKNFEKLKTKNLIVFTVGLADPNQTDYTELKDLLFTKEMQNHIKFFHLRGSMDYTDLSFIHSQMMKMMYKQTLKKENKDEQDKLLIETYGGNIDFFDEKSLSPIISACN